jgi:hypothetical protein
MSFFSLLPFPVNAGRAVLNFISGIPGAVRDASAALDAKSTFNQNKLAAAAKVSEVPTVAVEKSFEQRNNERFLPVEDIHGGGVARDLGTIIIDVKGDVKGSELRNNRQRNGTSITNFDGPTDIWSGPQPPLVFPSDLISTTALKFPFVGFVARKGAPGERSVFLPVPPGISFSDNMQYSSIDLGIIGKAVAGATNAAVNEGGFMSGAGGALGSAAGTLVNQMRSANAAAVSSLVARNTGSDNVANFIDIGSKQVIAPNTNTAFQNSGIRQFQFSFKMMPRDRGEANTITEILKRFRQNMYPMGNDLILTYPPIWNIYFYDGAKTGISKSKDVGAAENTKLPGIHECYLIAMNAVYNSSSNMFHEDGHPIETDIQLTFEETRALTLADISKYSEGRAPSF